MRKFLIPFAAALMVLFLFGLNCGCKKVPAVIPQIPQDTDTTKPVVIDTPHPVKLNVIFVLADDIGYEIPTYTGGQSYQTPNLDFMAANGTQFTQCYGSPLCSPSRFMLLTGKYNYRNYTVWGTMDQSQRTFANIFKLAGYNTCASGKWQFDGGDTSIRTFGFDKYMVNNPYNITGSNEDHTDRFYKNPQIYTMGAYLPDSATKDKYGQDMFRDYVFNFIDSNANKKPFFIYWALDLCHTPFSPTPDDPEFATWDPEKSQQAADTTYFPSMVKYMDKCIGQLIEKIRADSIENNTIIVFTGDNGTTNAIHSEFNGMMLPGGKATTLNLGTHLPLLAYCPGIVPAGRKDSTLISFVDFMATFADIANISVPASYGATDGATFAPQLKGQPATVVRGWVFNHYPGGDDAIGNPDHLRRWMQNTLYKQYDTTENSKSGKFYNLVTDPFEEHPLTKEELTPQEKETSVSFFKIMQTLH